MIDIHSHILPMVDDGSDSVEMSLEMVDAAYRHGTTSLILTPHLAYAYGFENPNEKIEELFGQFSRIVEDVGIPIDLYLGCEFLYTSKDSFQRHKDEITRLNHTKYLLMEFYFDVDANTILEAVETVLEEGWIPIVAHPERFEAIQIHVEIAKQVKKMGGYLQMNKGSILKSHGRRAYETVIELLDRGYIDFVGSDAHHPIYRDSKMDEAYHVCRHMFDERYIDQIFYSNPIKQLNIKLDEEEYED